MIAWKRKSLEAKKLTFPRSAFLDNKSTWSDFKAVLRCLLNDFEEGLRCCPTGFKASFRYLCTKAKWSKSCFKVFWNCFKEIWIKLIDYKISFARKFSAADCKWNVNWIIIWFANIQVRIGRSGKNGKGIKLSQENG